MSTNIIKNENGTYSFNDILITSQYDKETKLHTFTLVKNYCVPVQHIGSHLTLRNKLTSLIEELLSTENIPASAPVMEEESEFENFKKLVLRFDNTTGEEREGVANEMRLFYIRVKLAELFREFHASTGEEREQLSRSIADLIEVSEVQIEDEPELEEILS